MVPSLPGPGRVQGKALWQALGFANERAFQRARSTGALSGLRLYPVEGQSRGVYARADELREYLAMHRPPLPDGGNK